jgi:hypothetical protein
MRSFCRTSAWLLILSYVAVALAIPIPAATDDPLPVDSTWKGSITSKDQWVRRQRSDRACAMTLRVTARDGENFAADCRYVMQGNSTVEYSIEGKVRGGQIAWHTTELMKGDGIQPPPAWGTIQGGQVTAQFDGKDSTNNPLRGTITLHQKS